MKYEEIAKQILPLVGGNENISSFTNCMTRLRVNVKDTSKVDAGGLKNIAGVLGVVEGEQTQIIVGPGHAQRLREAFEKETGVKADAVADATATKDIAADMKEKVKAKQQSAWQRGLKHVGNIFIPLIPGFVGTGLIAAIANVLKTLDTEYKWGLVTNPWFLLFAAMGTLLVTTLHIVVGYNAGKEFGGTPVLGAIAGALVFSPALTGILANPDKGIEAVQLTLPFINLTLSVGLGGVIGVILSAFIFAKIENFIRRYVPAVLDLFLVPLSTILAGSVVTLFFIMPIAAFIMKGITYLLIDVALNAGGVVGGFVLAASFLPLVMLGIHHGLTPVHAELIKEVGFTVLLPILAMAGAGQVGAAIAVYVKTSNHKLKELIGSALPAGFLGVGEPLIYGVSLPLFYPFITACLGAGFGGAVIALGGEVGAIAIGPSGLVLIPLIANGMWLWYIAGLIVSYVAGFLLTYFFGYKESMLEKLEN